MHLSISMLLACLGLAEAHTHELFAGSFAGSTILRLQYNDVTSSLAISQNNTINTSSGSKWIALDEKRQNLYVATTGAFQSYAISSNLSLEYRSNVSLSSNCSNANFVVASTSSPFTVFGAPYSNGCSSLAMSVDASNSLEDAFANLTYDSTAGVHGLALSPDNDFIYSADDMGDAVWTHSYDSEKAVVTELQKINAPTGANPRHLATHPNGKWVYVVYEAASQIATYSRDEDSGLLTDTNTTYSLLPSAYTNTSSYWADEALFSMPSNHSAKTSPKYLIASTRSRTTTSKGYVSAFALDADTGAITEQLFLLPTTGSGGSANAVSPSRFSEDIFAIADSGSNFVEVWRINGTSAAAIAHLGLSTAPANVVWHS